MNIDKIFSLFTPTSSSNTQSAKKIELTDEVIVEYYIKMYQKLIENFHTSGKEFLKVLSKSPDLNLVDFKDIESAGKYMMYSRAWDYISFIDSSNIEHCKILKNYKNTQLVKYIKMSIKHFEVSEEYKKCAHLKKILDKLEET